MSGTTASWAALILYVTGLLLAFGVRTWSHLRATGSAGFRGISGPPGSVGWWGGILFVVALALGVAAPILTLTGLLPPPPPLLHPAATVIGLLVAVAGLALTLVAQSGMGLSWRIGVDESERTELVQTGIFRAVRNPIFTGMATVSGGMLLMVPTIASAAALVCLIAAVQIQVRVTEEPYLARMHGQIYATYRARTGRFLPKLSR